MTRVVVDVIVDEGAGSVVGVPAGCGSCIHMARRVPPGSGPCALGHDPEEDCLSKEPRFEEHFDKKPGWVRAYLRKRS